MGRIEGKRGGEGGSRTGNCTDGCAFFSALHIPALKLGHTKTADIKLATCPGHPSHAKVNVLNWNFATFFRSFCVTAREAIVPSCPYPCSRKIWSSNTTAVSCSLPFSKILSPSLSNRKNIFKIYWIWINLNKLVDQSVISRKRNIREYLES